MSQNQKKRSHQHDCLSTPVFPSASSIPRSCPRPQERRAAELLALFDLPLSEELWVLLLNKQHEVQARLPLYKGTVDSSVLRVAEIYRPALVGNCPSLIVCHNHCSIPPS